MGDVVRDHCMRCGLHIDGPCACNVPLEPGLLRVRPTVSGIAEWHEANRTGWKAAAYSKLWRGGAVLGGAAGLQIAAMREYAVARQDERNEARAERDAAREEVEALRQRTVDLAWQHTSYGADARFEALEAEIERLRTIIRELGAGEAAEPDAGSEVR